MGVLRTFEQSCKSAADASQKQLLFILKDNADTEYGKKYHFSDISSVSEYKKQVPFSTFEDYEDFVSKNDGGEGKTADSLSGFFLRSYFVKSIGGISGYKRTIER